MAGFGSAAAVTLLVKVLADTSKAGQDLDQFASKSKSAGDTVRGLAAPATVAIGAIGLFGAAAVDSASDVEQAYGAVDSVFKDNAQIVKRWAGDSAEAVGLSSAEYAQMAAVIGSQLKNMGTDMTNLGPKTDELIAMGADLAATYGGTTAEAVQALSSALRGERDPIERYGISIKQAGLEALVGKENLKAMTEEQKAAALANATLALAAQQGADAQGAFAREADTAAHAQQVANASWTNAQAALGEALLPALILVSDALTAFSGFVQENSTVVLVVVGVIAALAAGILAVNVAMAAWRAITTVVTAAQWLLNSALFANPIGLVVLAILALVAAFVVAYNKSETFRKIVDSVFKAVMSIVKSAVDFIVQLFGTLGAILAGPFELFKTVVNAVIGAVRGVLSAFGKFVSAIFAPIKAGIELIQSGIRAIKKAIDDLPDLPRMPWDTSSGRSAPALALAPAPGLRALGAPVGRAGGTPTPSSFGSQVTLVLDREVFGRATISSLRRYDRRNGAAQVLPRWA